jgi:hypothetical protein
MMTDWAHVAESFEIGVTERFLPLARKAGLPLVKICDGVYDIVGKGYRLRIRRGIGHGGGFLVTLSNEEVDPRDPIKIVNEIGLGRIARYNGATREAAAILSRDNSLEGYKKAAKVADEYALPYLLGVKSDYGQIKQQVKDELERSGELKKE